MINALYEPFPDSIYVNGIEYSIITDFREWFRFADMVADTELSNRDKLLMMTQWLLEPPDRITSELVTALCDFYKAKALEHEMPEYEDDENDEYTPAVLPVLSWKIDAPFIIGDFLHYYHIDLLEAKMHWWRFRILFSALPDDSQMMKRIGYRSVDISQIKSESERKRIMKMKQLYALPFEMDDEAIGAVFGGAM